MTAGVPADPAPGALAALGNRADSFLLIIGVRVSVVKAD